MMQCCSNDAEDNIHILFLSTYHSQRLIKYPTEVSISPEFTCTQDYRPGAVKNPPLHSYFFVSAHIVEVVAYYNYKKVLFAHECFIGVYSKTNTVFTN